MPSPLGRVGPAQLVRGHVLLPAESAAPWLLLPRQRHYRLFVPSRAADGASPLPLVVMIHGCRQDAESFARGTRMDELAETHGFAVLYPEQAQLANVRRCWNWFEAKTASGAGECELVLEMIREASRKAAIADRKVFVAGLSSGGALAALLAFHHPERFQAVAVHSGLPPVWPISATLAFTVMKRGPEGSAQAMAERFWQQPHRRGMRLTGPPPLLVLHGDADTRVSEVNAGALVTLWRSILELAPEAAGPIEKRSSTHAAQAGMRAYTQTDYLHNGRLFLRGIRIHGLAHAWSGGDAREPFFDACGPEASALIWAFFEKQRQAHKPSVNV
ncbi:MAG: PHB depolymerase family esterase [Casimicrobiaceae bacterium]|nr:PHB depolymerase family esterase [Casimicrobiaceae bacterium]